MNKYLLVLLALLLHCSLASSADPLSIRYIQTGTRYAYPIKLLELVISKTNDTNGKALLQPLSLKVSKARQILLFNEGAFDIMWMPTSRERERMFMPIKTPILRGILGYRVLLIHRDRMDDFSDINTLEQLKLNFTAGFGSHWGDLSILQHNNIDVVTSPEYDSLFKMLVAGRFDYFPRGIDEAWLEVEEKRASLPEIAVEENLGFYYPYPYYFFVNKSNNDLANRIRKGLALAIEDGSFKSLFLQYHSRYIDQAKLDNRLVFHLENLNLPENTEAPDVSWWLNPSQQ